MANLPEIDEFTVGIYQLELTDPVEGGPDGIDNKQAKGLTNRTLWLKNQLAALSTTVSGFVAAIAALTTRVTNLEAVQPKTVFFLRKTTVALGDFPNPGPDEKITISFPNLGTSSYMVLPSLVSKSVNYDVDNDVILTIKNKTPTSFDLCGKEVSNNVQNLDLDYIIIPL